ncbi:cartilage-associated protein-like [Pectinophora gossypiella]|uniref:Leprecan-like alpha-helical domain-containing protein n=1 Tax=Pectinophora gossypiella TaxID=13191 RepID=A0A1E1WQH5_PECGO|nr:cartilage-associated protein-like [Pectinophora gossypiella]
MLKTSALIKVSVFLITYAVVRNEAIKYSSLDRSYQRGVEAYKGERWSECIKRFEEALHLYKLYKAVVINCRLKCNSQQFEPQVKDNIEDLQIYEKFFQTKNCLKTCQDLAFEEVSLKDEVSDSILFNMHARKPYEYLQMCYFQMYALPKAASATYTYLQANPDDESMLENLKYYSEQPEVDVNEITDLESEDFMVLHNLGLKSYKKNNWGETIASMEEVITDYLSWENRCRVECERQPDQEWSSEFVVTISNNIASLLHCHQQCQDKVKSFGYKSGSEFLADVLNYIQISYYRLDKYDDAAKAVASYLILLPDDEDMLENKRIYSTLIKEGTIHRRSDIDYYFKRDNYEKKLLNLFHRGDDNKIDSNAI